MSAFSQGTRALLICAPVERPVLALHAGCASAQELCVKYEGQMLSRSRHQAHQTTDFQCTLPAQNSALCCCMLHTCGTVIQTLQFIMYHSMDYKPCRHEGSTSALCIDSMVPCYQPPYISTWHCFLTVVPLSSGSIRCSTPRPCARQRYRSPCAPFPGARQIVQTSDWSPVQRAMQR